jgi:hypothetical protein
MRARLAGSVLVVAAAPWAAAPAAAQAGPPPTGPVAVVTVPYTRDPVDKSYRKMIKGMERFERDHALAPHASLRFRVLPRSASVNMNGISLRVIGDSTTIPVPVAADNSFVLPRNDQALREDAALVANRKTSSMTWRASVVTPDLPAGTRRLGDLRLECRVGVEAGLVSNSPPLVGWLTDALLSADRVCTSPEGNYLFFTERPLFSVRLRAGERTEVLPFRMLYAGGEQTGAMLNYCDCQVLLDRSYYAPIWDPGWPDATLVEFEYMDDPPAAAR